MPTIGDSAWAEKKPLTAEEAPVNAGLRSTMGGKRVTCWPDTPPCFFLFSLVLLAPVFSFVSLLLWWTAICSPYGRAVGAGGAAG